MAKKSILLLVFGLTTVFLSSNSFAEELITFQKPSSSSERGEYESHAVLVAKHQATLSSEFPGKINSLSVKPSESFEPGDVLISFDCDLQKAELEKVEAELNSAKVAYQSATKLDELQSISHLEVVQAKSHYYKALAEVSKLNTVVKACVIKAPFKGQVIETLVHIHETIKPGDPLLTIVDNSELTVRLFVPSDWLQWITPGTVFTVQFKELNHPFEATVTKIGAKVDAASQTVSLFAKLNNPEPQLIGGMSGIALFKRKKLDDHKEK